MYREALFELANLGETEDMVVCDHLCDHLIGRIGRKREAEIGVLIRWRGVLIRRALVEDDAAAQVMQVMRRSSRLLEECRSLRQELRQELRNISSTRLEPRRPRLASFGDDQTWVLGSCARKHAAIAKS